MRVNMQRAPGSTDAGQGRRWLLVMVAVLLIASDWSWAGGVADCGGEGQWVPIPNGPNGQVHSMVTFDDGGGPVTVAGGTFTTAGGAPCSNVARWDGQVWSPLGAGLNGTVRSLVVHDDGTGVALYAGGQFSASGSTAASNVARWNGTQWEPVGGGIGGVVNILASATGGSIAGLYAGGDFDSAGGQPAKNLAKWNGSQWQQVGGGVTYPLGPDDWGAEVHAIVVHDLGSGPRVVLGGRFTRAGTIEAICIAQWDGASFSSLGWLPLDLTDSPSINGWVTSLAVLLRDGIPRLHATLTDNDFGLQLYSSAARLASWSGQDWATEFERTEYWCFGCPPCFPQGSAAAYGVAALGDVRYLAASVRRTYPCDPAQSYSQRLFVSSDGVFELAADQPGFSSPAEPSDLRVGVFDRITSPPVIWMSKPGETLILTCEPACIADLDDDGVVGGADIAVLLGYWGLSGKNVVGDLTGDGTVNGADLSVLLGSWGPCP